MDDFTPGPWMCWQKLDEMGTNYWRVRTSSEITMGDTLRGYCGEANAQLIAAAPDMYEALGTVVKEGWLVGSPLESVCRQALAKARGEKG